MGTKSRPGEFDCHNTAEADEPVFTLRARDVQAPRLIRDWIRRRRQLRPAAAEPDPAREERKLREAEACALAMEDWRTGFDKRSQTPGNPGVLAAGGPRR